LEYSLLIITIAETPPYTRKADKLLSSTEKEALIFYLSANPKSGALITGTGGVKMSSAFEEIQEGLQAAIGRAKGINSEVILHKPHSVNVKKLRAKMDMTQQQFCAMFGIALGTLRHWEQGDRSPKGPALVLLNVVEKNPQAVMAALAG
jgi:putative transcriptional regulator